MFFILTRRLPLNDQKGRNDGKVKPVCEAYSALSEEDVKSLFGFVRVRDEVSEGDDTIVGEKAAPKLPDVP